MNLRTCPREPEVKTLIERGQWPQAGPPELHAHVSACKSCREFVLITVAFQRARSQAVATAKLGSPGLLWWRAQLRRRNAAVERNSRPIVSAQIFALAFNIAIAIAVSIWQARHGLSWLTWFEQLPRNFVSQWLSALIPSGLFENGAGAFQVPLLLGAVASIIALVGGLVVYFASEKQ